MIDLDGNIIGSINPPAPDQKQEDKKDGRVSVFGTFDPDSYRYRGKNLGSGGGTGKGERYDPARIKKLRAMQLAYRRQIRPGKGIGVSATEEDTLKKQKRSRNWNKQGILKNVSSYRVNMENAILADKAIPAVLARSIDTEQSDIPLSAIVERNIYSESGRKIIIPAGSRIIGELTGTSAQEEVGSASKVEISWKRLVRPDGAAFVFESGVSGDASGRAGVGAYMDRQLLKKYGLPILQSTVSSAILYAMATNDTAAVGESGQVAKSGRQEAAEDARSRFSEVMQEVADDLFEETKKLKTRLFVPAGTRVTVYAKTDLWLRSEMEDYEDEYINKKEVLIDPDKPDENEKDDEDAGGMVDPNAQGSQTNPNDPNNMQQQQQIYYNNYTGQPPPRQSNLIDDKPQQQQPQFQQPVPQQETQVKKDEPVDPVPELDF